MKVESREYPSRPLVGVGAVVLHGGRVLLVRRARQPLRGRWSLPGGLVEADETLAQAIRREIAEETGLQVRVKQVIAVMDRITRDARRRVRFHYVLADFLCTVKSGKLRAASDASDARWVGRRELGPYQLPSPTLRIIEQAFARRKPSPPRKADQHQR